jgi:pimeloyl-ACP methyl ester carboxylesterase
MLEKRTIELNGVTVHMTDAPGKPLMLLVRMAAQESGLWDAIWPRLAQSFTVAALDLQRLPAAGRTDAPAEMFRGLSAACVIAAEALGHDTFHLFGWNGGTQIVLRCLVDHGERVRSSILLDPFFELPDMRHVEMAIDFKRALFDQADRRIYAHYWVMAGLSDGFIANRFDEVARIADARVERDRFVRSDPERFFAWVRALRRNWLSDEEFARIRVPTLVLATELDRWNAGPSVEMARALCARSPALNLEIMRGVGGLFPVEAPELFAKTAGNFLDKFVGDRSG